MYIYISRYIYSGVCKLNRKPMAILISCIFDTQLIFWLLTLLLLFLLLPLKLNTRLNVALLANIFASLRRLARGSAPPLSANQASRICDFLAYVVVVVAVTLHPNLSCLSTTSCAQRSFKAKPSAIHIYLHTKGKQKQQQQQRASSSIMLNGVKRSESPLMSVLRSTVIFIEDLSTLLDF